MGIFDKLKYGNTFGRTVSIKDTAVKQYPKETKKIEESIMLYNIMHKDQNLITNIHKEQNNDYEAKLNKVLTELKKQQNRTFIDIEMILLNIKIMYKYSKNIFRNSKYIKTFKASRYFDAEYYMEKNKDLKKLRVNPYLHYLFFS